MDRKVKLEELQIVVLHKNVTQKGTFRKRGFKVHIGRITRKGGDVVAVACGAKEEIRWAYHFSTHMLNLMPLCNACRAKASKMVDGWAAHLVESAGQDEEPPSLIGG